MSDYILVVDDEPSICEMICSSLEAAGFEVKLSVNGALAHQMIINKRPDLIVLDWMMPMLSGIELTRRLKKDERTRDIPIIMLTARSEEEDRICGLDAGADDYISKPFSPRELIARIQAILRRTQTKSKGILSAGELTLDSVHKTCTIAGQNTPLGPLELKLLTFFMQNPNRVFSRPQLLDRVWGGNVYVEDRTVDVHIRRLRKAISFQQQNQRIQTVRGAGYRFCPDDTLPKHLTQATK